MKKSNLQEIICSSDCYAHVTDVILAVAIIEGEAVFMLNSYIDSGRWAGTGVNKGWFNNLNLDDPIIEECQKPQVRPVFILSCGILAGFGAVLLSLIGGENIKAGLGMGTLLFASSVLFCMIGYQHAYITIDDYEVEWKAGFIPFKPSGGWSEQLNRYDSIVINEVAVSYSFFGIKPYKATRPNPVEARYRSKNAPTKVIEVTLKHGHDSNKSISLGCFLVEEEAEWRDFADQAAARFELPILVQI